MTNYFEITFGDLSYEKQQDLIETVSQYLLENWKLCGEELLGREWHEPKPKTWEEAYMRDIKSYDDDELVDINWKYEVESLAEEEAENRLWKGFKYLEVGVEI